MRRFLLYFGICCTLLISGCNGGEISSSYTPSSTPDENILAGVDSVGSVLIRYEDGTTIMLSRGDEFFEGIATEGIQILAAINNSEDLAGAWPVTTLERYYPEVSYVQLMFDKPVLFSSKYRPPEGSTRRVNEAGYVQLRFGGGDGGIFALIPLTYIKEARKGIPVLLSGNRESITRDGEYPMAFWDTGRSLINLRELVNDFKK